MTYYTRADWGAAPPTRSMAQLDPKRVRYWTLHFDGSGTLGLRDLRTLMRAFQRYHQKTRGFADIAYNSAAGQSGDRAEGRGAYVGGHILAGQNAESWGCIAAIGATEAPTPALLAALREDYEAACKWAGRRLIPRGHTQWPEANKACPGTHLMRFLTTLTADPLIHKEPIVSDPLAYPGVALGRHPKPPGRVDQHSAVGTVQRWLGLKVDDTFGPATEAAVEAFQRSAGLTPVDGIVGPDTWATLAAKHTPKPVTPEPVTPEESTMALSDSDVQRIADAVWKRLITVPDGSQVNAGTALGGIRNDLRVLRSLADDDFRRAVGV